MTLGHTQTLKTLIFGLFLLSQPATGHNRRSASTHVHGLATLNVVLEQKVLQIELEVPMGDLVGFEREAKTTKEKQRWSDAKKKLLAGATLFDLPKDAKCSLIDVDIEPIHVHHSHPNKLEKPKKEDAHSCDCKHTHADVRARYRFSCDQPQMMERIRVDLFKSFVSLQKVQVNSAIDFGQSQKTLSASDCEFKFKG